MKDFFISYNRHDQHWAEWIAWTLEEAGFTVVIQAWDFRPGGNFALDMNRAVAETQATIAVLSKTFLQSDYTAPEWAAAFARDPQSLGRKLIPVRVGECQPTGLLTQINYVDLVGVTAPSVAKALVLNALQERAKPSDEPGFPGAVTPKAERTEPSQVEFPGTETSVSENTPAPSPARPPSLVYPAPAPIPARAGKNWAIAIGINNYDNLQALSYAKRDAEAVRDYCRHEIGFEQVYYFAEDAPDLELEHGPPFKPLPTFAKLDRFLDIRFERPFLHPGDNFWFFFAGHGKRHSGRDYLMPSDVNPRNIEGTAIALNHVTERLRRCGADNVILLLDACRNDGDRDGEGLGIEKQQGVVTLFACSPSERSYEIEALQQGAFTHTLLQGLRLQGEGNCATVERLDQYLRYRVPELNRRYHKPPQTPYANAEPIAKRHLILLPQNATLADVTLLKNDALEAEAEQDWEFAEQLWTRVLIVSPGDQQAIRAIKRVAIRANASPPRAAPAEPPIAPAPSRSATASRETPVPVSTPTIPTFDFDVVTVNDQGQESNRRKGQAMYFTEDVGDGVALELVAIPGGTFQMGSPAGEGDDDERPQHPVTVKPLLMGKHPVTQAQWRAVAALPKINRDLEPDPSKFKGSKRPVEWVSWHEAVEFCARLVKQTRHDYRLPSEAEWENACRAGTTTPFHFGATITTALANYDGNYTYGAAPKGEYREQTTEVGTFPPNAFGLYDLHGNVWEWCLDHWHDNYQGAPTDGSAWIAGGDAERRLLRGGSWYLNPSNCRSAYRSRYGPDSRLDYIGFRVVCASACALQYQNGWVGIHPVCRRRVQTDSGDGSNPIRKANWIG